MKYIALSLMWLVIIFLVAYMIVTTVTINTIQLYILCPIISFMLLFVGYVGHFLILDTDNNK